MKELDLDSVLEENHTKTEITTKYPTGRVIQRYLVPNWMVAVYFSVRYHCLVSTQSRVQFTNRITFGKGTVVKPFAILQTQSGRISIGHDCAIGSFNHISTGQKDVRMGDYVRIGPHVTILGGSRNFRERNALIVHQGSHHKSVIIGDDVLIGAGCVILPGSIIGKGAVVGAASVINGDVPAFTIVAGSPARILGKRV